MRRTAALLLAALCACSDEPPPPPPGDTTVRVRARPAATPLKEAPGLAALGEDRDGGDGKLHVYLLDVGQGDAALIVSPTGRTVLVDTGPSESAAFLANRLAEQARGPLDLLALTQAGDEHSGGLESVLRNTSADRVLVPSTDGEGMAWALSVARARGVPVFTPGAGDAAEPLSVQLGGGAALEVLWPRGAGSSPSEGLVLRLSLGDTSVLFAGDARPETEAKLLELGLVARASVLKVAAHGLAPSTSEAWLSAVQPLVALLSFGAGNTAGAPSQAVLDRLSAAHVESWRTDLDGELQLDLDGRQVVLSMEHPTAGDPPGVRHRYVRGEPPARIAPAANTVRPAWLSARPRAVAVTPAAAAAPTRAGGELELPPNWVRPPAARPQAPAAAGPLPPPAAAAASTPRPPERQPAPPRPSSPQKGDELELPGNWVKPPATAPAPAQPAPSARAAQPASAPPPAPPPAARPTPQPTPRAPAAGGYVASSRSNKFHLAGCRAAAEIKPENRLTFTTREQAASGREPAKDCNP